MSRLEDLLHDASEPRDAWSLDPAELAHEGRRRVVRRRWRRAGAVVATLAVGGIAVAVPLASHPGDGHRVADAGSAGVYRDVVLSRAEMERRCTAELNARNGTDTDYVAGRAPDGTAVPSTGAPGYVETREGWAVQLLPEGETWPRRKPPAMAPPDSTADQITPAARLARLDEPDVCIIPQAGRQPSEPAIAGGAPDADDHGAILDACSRAAGYDLGGWTVLAAANRAPYAVPKPPQSVDAVLLSGNGHAAVCWLDPDGTSGIGMIPRAYLTPDGDPLLLPEDADPASRYSVVAPSTDTAAGFGVVPGLPDDWTIELLVDGSPLTTITTNDGGFAYDVESGPVFARRWDARVRDAEGRLVWEGRLDVPAR